MIWVFFSFLWETCGPNVFRGDFHDSFALDLQVKDIRLFVEMAKQANVSIFHILLGNYTCSPYFAKLHCFLPPEGQRCIEFTTRTSLKDMDKSVDSFLFEYFPKRANTLNLKKPKYAPSKTSFWILYLSTLLSCMRVFYLVHSTPACSEAFSDHCNFCTSY